jgi:hypothetical protein
MPTHTRPDTEGVHDGSTTIALDTSPSFTKLVFWEKEPTAARLRAGLAANRPADKR